MPSVANDELESSPTEHLGDSTHVGRDERSEPQPPGASPLTAAACLWRRSLCSFTPAGLSVLTSLRIDLSTRTNTHWSAAHTGGGQITTLNLTNDKSTNLSNRALFNKTVHSPVSHVILYVFTSMVYCVIKGVNI